MSAGREVLARLRALPVGCEFKHSVGRMLSHDGSRYDIDFSGLLREGWQQYDTDQDASYFGVWVNRAKRETLTYAEGDWTLATCASDEAFTAELAAMAEFYGAPPPAFTVISEDGSVTTYTEERPK